MPADVLPLNVASVREDFPILQRKVHVGVDPVSQPGVPLIYLDNAASNQRPRQVIDAMVRLYEQDYANVHRGIHELSETSTDCFEQVRDRVQLFVNAAEREEIIFTRGTTESINLVAHSWGDANLKPGDEILLTEMEHHANIVPWQQLAERTGATVRFAPISDDGVLDMQGFDRVLGPRTRLVAITALSNVLGTINPVAEIIARAKSHGALTLVDAAQSIAHLHTDVRQLGVDFLAFSGHKMLGPSGVGVLYGRRELLEAMPPFMGGGAMIRRVRQSGFESADLPAKFEAGTPPIAPVVGLGAAIDYLQSVGLDAIHQHEQQLTRQAYQGLAAVPGLKMLGPGADERGAIVAFALDDVHAHDVAQILDRRGIAVRAGHHCTMPLHERLGIKSSSRASFSLYNTPDEVNQLIEAVAELKQTFRRRQISLNSRGLAPLHGRTQDLRIKSPLL